MYSAIIESSSDPAPRCPHFSCLISNRPSKCFCASCGASRNHQCHDIFISQPGNFMLINSGVTRLTEAASRGREIICRNADPPVGPVEKVIRSRIPRYVIFSMKIHKPAVIHLIPHDIGRKNVGDLIVTSASIFFFPDFIYDRILSILRPRPV